MATGALRATMALTEPGAAPICRTSQRWLAEPTVTNSSSTGARPGSATPVVSGLIALLCKTDPDVTPRHLGISVVLVDSGADAAAHGLRISAICPSWVTRGRVMRTGLREFPVPAASILGGEAGKVSPK